jgi:hypothetical protein
MFTIMRGFATLAALAALTCTAWADEAAPPDVPVPATQPDATQPVEVEPPPATQPTPTPTPMVPPPVEKKKKKKGAQIKHHEGHDLELRATNGMRVRIRASVEPMFRYTTVSTLPDDAVDMIIRRARLGVDWRFGEHERARVEIQLKNMHFGLLNLYGTWRFNKSLALSAGFLKAPGGLERDTYALDQPFIERSIVSSLSIDREVGVRIDGRAKSILWAASITRNGPPGADGGDPEDMPVYPPGIEVDDITRGPSKWNNAERVQYVPSEAFEAGFTFGARIRPDDAEPDFGERIAEPYDSGVVAPRPWSGYGGHVGADLAMTRRHARILVEGGAQRDGEQLKFDYTMPAPPMHLGGHLNQEEAYVVFGWTPHGHYGAAVDAAPLLDGWELITRVEGARVKPVDISQVLFVGVTVGANFQISPTLRVQADLGYEKFNAAAEYNNSGAVRWIGQLWACWRI